VTVAALLMRKYYYLHKRNIFTEHQIQYMPISWPHTLSDCQAKKQKTGSRNCWVDIQAAAAAAALTSRSQSKFSKAALCGMDDVSRPLSRVPTSENVRWRMWLFSRCRFFLNSIASICTIQHPSLHHVVNTSPFYTHVNTKTFISKQTGL